MSKVTKESLEMRIQYMSDRSLSLNEEYQFEAYRLLFKLLSNCEHDWDSDFGPQYKGGFYARCRKCGKEV